MTAAGVPRAPLPKRYAVQYGRAHAYADLPRTFHYEKTAAPLYAGGTRGA